MKLSLKAVVGITSVYSKNSPVRIRAPTSDKEPGFVLGSSVDVAAKYRPEYSHRDLSLRSVLLSWLDIPLRLRRAVYLTRPPYL